MRVARPPASTTPVIDGLDALIFRMNRCPAAARMRMPSRVQQDHTIRIFQPVIALDEGIQRPRVAETKPGGAIRQHISVHGARDVQGGAHAGAGFTVPAATWLDAGGLPQLEFQHVGAAVIAAGGERQSGGRDPGEGAGGILVTADAGRVPGGTDQHKIIVHYRDALEPMTFFDELSFRFRMMNQQYIGIAIPRQANGLAGADGDDPYLDARFLRERRQQVTEQAGVFGGGSRGKNDEFIRSRGHGGEPQGEQHKPAAIWIHVRYSGFRPAVHRG
jgi:hypothetical protein